MAAPAPSQSIVTYALTTPSVTLLENASAIATGLTTQRTLTLHAAHGTVAPATGDALHVPAQLTSTA